MILHFDYDKTPQHLCEMAACAEIVKAQKTWHKGTLDSYTALDQFYQYYFSTGNGVEFARVTKSINDGPPLRILDVGAGRGETSLYLANQGHRVFPVEPSPEFCNVIEYMGQRFGKDLTIYNCSAEFLDVPGEQFDVVIFNISLHHCDDPVKALKNVRSYLRPDGKLFVISEPMLPFFKNSSKVLEAMNADPDEFGHYGGNEHVYHCAEYVSMIRQAGFQNVSWELAARYRSKDAIAPLLATDTRRSSLRLAVKNSYLHLVYFLYRAKLKPLLAVLQRLSLVQLTFAATK